MTLKFRTFVLGPVLGLERNEYVAVAWSFICFFCVLSSYYIIRPVREAMAVDSGADTVPLLFTATFVVMMAATPVFGWVTSRYSRRVFLPWVYLFFIANILVFWLIFSQIIDDGTDHIWLGRVFFVWISVFNLFVVSVFWSFMADIYTRDQGRRLFGFIAAGGSIGAIGGGAVTSLLVVEIGFENLLPIAAVLLSLAMLCIQQLNRWFERDQIVEVHVPADLNESLGGNPFSGITHVFQSKYFLGITLSSVIASLLGTALYMFPIQLVQDSIAGTNERTEFFSNINFWTNLFALLGQMFLVRHVVVRFGIGRSLAVLPAVSIVGFLLLAFDPVLGAVAILTITRRALGFSFSKPATDMLYSVVTPEEKYKTKNFIDTAIYRFGDIVGIWMVQLMMGLGIAGVSLTMLPFAVIWTAVSLWLGRDYKRQAITLKMKGFE
ncbi:MAG: MFS transporter [Gammaproteobacteria bacterium]|nr:MFS transporter [Gammaproteobacteria bacterium]